MTNSKKKKPSASDCKLADIASQDECDNYVISQIILEWTTSLDTSSRTLFVREGGREDVHVKGGCPRHVERRVTYYVRLLLNFELRNYVISRQIVERRVT